MNKEELIEVFQDTEKHCKSNDAIGNASKMCVERTYVYDFPSDERNTRLEGRSESIYDGN